MLYFIENKETICSCWILGQLCINSIGRTFVSCWIEEETINNEKKTGTVPKQQRFMNIFICELIEVWRKLEFHQSKINQIELQGCLQTFFTLLTTRTVTFIVNLPPEIYSDAQFWCKVLKEFDNVSRTTTKVSSTNNSHCILCHVTAILKNRPPPASLTFTTTTIFCQHQPPVSTPLQNQCQTTATSTPSPLFKTPCILHPAPQ